MFHGLRAEIVRRLPMVFASFWTGESHIAAMDVAEIRFRLSGMS
jgi:hypothetical protein